MKAARFHDQGKLSVDDIAEPSPADGEVKLKVEWCGLCGTDLHEYTGGPIFVPTEDAPHPVTGGSAPVVLGHEFSGRVVECGANVTHVSEGDNITVEPLIRDTTCAACQRGLYNVCENVGFHGLSGGGGGLAEYTVVPEYMVHRLPAGMSTEIGALIEPLAVGWHSVQQASFRAGQTAFVAGAGPIGLVTVLALKAAGARWIAVSEMADARKDRAHQFGADLVLDPNEHDVVDEIRKHTGDGVDASFECTGKKPTLDTAVQATRRHGTACNVAIWEDPTEFQPNDLVFTEVSLTASLGYAHEFPAVLAAVDDGRIDAGQLITSRIELDDVVREGFDELINNKDPHVKILVRP